MSGLGRTDLRSSTRICSPLVTGYESLKRLVGRASAFGCRPLSRMGLLHNAATEVNAVSWEGHYALESYTKPLFADRPILEAGFTSMTSDWDPDSGVLSYWSANAASEDEENLLRGFMLGLDREDGQRLDAFATMLPKGRCTITWGLALESPLRWLSLPVGECDRTQVVGNSHTFELHRPDPTRWRFAIASDGRESLGHSPFQVATFSLVTDSPRPPWSGLNVRFEAIDHRGTTQTNLRLRRLPMEQARVRAGEPPADA